MLRASVTAPFVLAAAVLTIASCRTAPARGPSIMQPGAPGEAARAISAGAAADVRGRGHTAADVQFVRQMLPHHAQALEMAALVAGRTTRADVQQLARRIALSQEDEIEWMREWLRARGEPLPDPHAHHESGGATMPGMLSPEEMRQIEAARGDAFDRLFLELMIRHHEGALVMVRHLFEAGGGQESDLFAFASDVEADQQLEIARMRSVLGRK